MRGPTFIFAGLMTLFWQTPTYAAPDSDIDRPKLVQWPSGDDMAAFYPDRAQRLEVEGSARLSCVANADGALEQCKVLHEWPLGFGFGEAALKLAPKFKVSKAGVFEHRIIFSLEGDDELYMSLSPPENRVKLITQPSRKDLIAAYPGDGSVVLHAALTCQLLADGRLRGCTPVDDQDPTATAAALGLIPRYRTVPPPQAMIGASTTLEFTFIPPDPEGRK